MYQKNSLEKIITFSCGIGSSLAEAEVAMGLAKQQDCFGYRLEEYRGLLIIDRINNAPVNHFINLRNYLLETISKYKKDEDIVSSRKSTTTGEYTSGMLTSLGSISDPALPN